jgi:hypothetical protein
MPDLATDPAGHRPRPARARTSPGVPRRAEVAAAAGLAAVLAHLLLAPLALVLAVAFQLTGRLTRWRPSWLTAPAGAGLAWLLALGPRAAWAGAAAGPRRVLGYLGGALADPARWSRPAAAYAGLSHWLPGQAPVALLLAAAETAAAGWRPARRAGLPAFRPGLIAAVRRQRTERAVRSGGVVDRSGACLGVHGPTGRPVCVPWAAAAGGVLVAGDRPAAVAAASFRLVHAAVRRRQPAVVVDLAAVPGLARSLAAVCAGAGAPLRVLGPGCYEPLRGRPPSGQADLIMGLLEDAAVGEPARQACRSYLNDLFAVLAAAPGGPAAGVLAEMATLLSPAALRTRLGEVPAEQPGRAALAERVAGAARRLAADPAGAAFLAGELAALRAGALGGWLRPAAVAAGEEQISLAEVVRDRAVAFFPLGGPGPDRAAQLVARLVALDLRATFAESARLGIGGDGLAWFAAGQGSAEEAVAGLARSAGLPGAGQPGGPGHGGAAGGPGGPDGAGPGGLVTVLSTVSRAAAARLAAGANVLILAGMPGPDRTGQVDGAAAGPDRPDQLAVLITGPPARAQPGRFVPADLR